MPRTLLLRRTYFGPGPFLIAALLAAGIVKGLWPHLRFAQPYPDPVAGWLAFDGSGKPQDFWAIGLFLGVGLLLSGVVAGVCWAVAPDGPDTDAGRAVGQLLLLCLIPAGWRLAVSAFTLSLDPSPPLVTAALVTLLGLVAIGSMGRFRVAPTAAELYNVVGALVLAPLLAMFAGLGLVMFACRAFPALAPHLHDEGAWLAGAGAAAVLVANTAHRFRSDTPAAFAGRAMRTLVVAQVGLPLLWFAAVPSPLIDPQHKFAAHYPGRLVAVVAVVAGVGLWRVGRRWRVAGSGRLAHVLAPAAVAAMAVFVHLDSLGLPMADAGGNVAVTGMFHLGEELLPWQQWVDFGRRPYTDFVPIHGLMNYLRGGLAALFFDGTVGDYPAAASLVAAAAAAAVALAAGGLVGPVAALFVLFVPLPTSDRMYFTAPALFLVATPALLARPARWLCVWIAASALLAAYNAALGPAFAVGTLPVAAWGVYRLAKARRWLPLVGIAAAVGALIGAGYATVPVRQTAVGFVRFVADNQWTNNVGNGVAWSFGWGRRDSVGGLGSSQFLWEAGRCGWMLVALACAGVAWREVARPAGGRRVPLLVVATGGFAILVASSPWVMGRIDAGSTSRPGAMSQLAVSFMVVPMVLIGCNRARLGRDLLVTAIGVGLVYPFTFTRLDPGGLQMKAEATRIVPADAVVVDGDTLGMRRLGRVLRPEPDFLDALVRLRSVLGEFLRPGETYLDLTNGTARYYFLGMKCPVGYAPYVACNAKLQAGMLRQLAADPVHATLILPDERYDGYPNSMRCYGVYRELVLHNVAVRRGAFTLLVDPARAPDVGPIGSEPQLRLLDAAYARYDLERLPTAWGRSWPTLADRFGSVGAVPVDRATTVAGAVPDAGYLTPTAPTPSVQWPVPAAVTDGTAADYVRLRLDAVPADAKLSAIAQANEPAKDPTGSAELLLALRWVGADGVASDPPVTFYVRPGELVVPLGSYPRWLLGRHPTGLRVELVNPRCVRRFRFTAVEFLRLKPVG